MLKRTIIFLVLNFAALAIGGMFTESGVPSEFYQNLSKAPWTPPGWVFGLAWTIIMISFAPYMAFLYKIQKGGKKIIALYSIQWVLNIAWNPIFFYFQEIFIGMISITMLTILIAYMFFNYRKSLSFKTLLLAPYLIWLIIATSLNGYIVFYN